MVRSYRMIGVWLLALLLVGGMVVSVVAISTSSHVEPSTPHVVQRTPAVTPDNDQDADDLAIPNSSPDGDGDGDTDD